MNTKDTRLVRTCYECRGTASGHRENYNYAECGLKNVTLKGVIVYRCTRCGSARVEIPNMDGLHRTIALMILEKESPLTSDEVRFLRTVAGFTATRFANALGVTKNTLSRWENGHRIGLQSDRSIRITCGLSIISEIANEQASTGVVALDNIQKTLGKIRKCMAQAAPRSHAKNTGDQHNDGQLLIDPEFPFAASVMPRVDSREVAEALVQ